MKKEENKEDELEAEEKGAKMKQTRWNDVTSMWSTTVDGAPDMLIRNEQNRPMNQTQTDESHSFLISITILANRFYIRKSFNGIYVT